ncbi:MAG: hypothetical protein ACRYG7_37095 [Janthinobacterium lividum]
MALGVALLVGTALAGGFWWSLEGRKKQAMLDGESYSAVCDTIGTITEHPACRWNRTTAVQQ